MILRKRCGHKQINSILSFEVFIDAIEQEIQDPKNKRKRKIHCSGKKKRHTVKTQRAVNKQGLIVHKFPPVNGSTHDYALYNHSHSKLSKEVMSTLDLGYFGMKKDYPRLKCVLSFKRQNSGWVERVLRLSLFCLE